MSPLLVFLLVALFSIVGIYYAVARPKAEAPADKQ